MGESDGPSRVYGCKEPLCGGVAEYALHPAVGGARLSAEVAVLEIECVAEYPGVERAVDHFHSDLPGQVEIGRASCRERV